MPSGAKRRKAEKRKKEKIANNSSNNNNSSNSSQQGNGDSPRSHDERDSDSGDLSSPTTFQQHQNPLRRDKEDENKDFSSIGSVSDKPHVDKIQVGGQEVNNGEGLNHEDDDGEVVVTKEVDIKSVKEPYAEGSISTSTSSNGEMKVVEKKSELESPQVEELRESTEGLKKVIDIVETLPVIEQVVSIKKEVIPDNPVKGAGQSAKPVEVVEVNIVEEIGDSSTGDLQSKEREAIVLPPSNGAGVDTSKGSGHPVQSHTLTKSNDQKDAAPVQPIVRPTSWKSCCGLFDVITGSSR